MRKARKRMSDLISRKEAIEALRYAQHRFTVADEAGGMGMVKWSEDVIYFDAAVNALSFLPSAQPEQRYTEEELRVFQHGISLSLLSKRSAQHWRYDEDTATEIKFLERLYEKIGTDIRGEEDEIYSDIRPSRRL